MKLQVTLLSCLLPLTVFNSVALADNFTPNKNDFTFKIEVDRGTFTMASNSNAKTYSVDCQDDGTWEAVDASGSYSCHYSNKGKYTIRLRDTSRTQSALSKLSFKGAKILTISQWGDQKWVSFNGFYQSSTLITLSASDAPNLLNVKGTKYTRFFDGDLTKKPTQKIKASVPVTVLKEEPKPIAIVKEEPKPVIVKVQPPKSPVIKEQSAVEKTDLVFIAKIKRKTFFITNRSSHKPYSIDCNNDGTWEVTNFKGADYTCHYTRHGEYTIRLRDPSAEQTAFAMLTFKSSRILDLTQWGTQKWAGNSLSSFFAGSLLRTISAKDAPDLLNITKMENMFGGASNFNGDLSHWDVSYATSMNQMFYGASAFDGDLSSWDVSNVSNAGNIFYGATSMKEKHKPSF